jgi:hypothetical protein
LTKLFDTSLKLEFQGKKRLYWQVYPIGV